MKKVKKVIFIALFSLSLIIFTISLIKIIEWTRDSISSHKEMDIIENVAEIQEIEDDENIEIVNEESIEKSNPYWDYIKMDLINVNFVELKKINPDTAGWIQIKGTNINYPFVKSKDNNFYLTHSFEKKHNGAGWIFLDYRNNITSGDNKNMILYGHSRLDKTMFGSLTNILKSEWLSDKNNYIIRMSAEKENTMWEIFSVYHIPTTNDYLKVEFQSDDEYVSFIDKIKDRTQHKFGTDVKKTDKILTLSTCYSEEEKFVVHAKMIKRMERKKEQ